MADSAVVPFALDKHMAPSLPIQHQKPLNPVGNYGRNEARDVTSGISPKQALECKKPASSRSNAAMPKEGVEPSPCCQDGILNPARLPVPPLRPKKASRLFTTTPALSTLFPRQRLNQMSGYPPASLGGGSRARSGNLKPPSSVLSPRTTLNQNRTPGLVVPSAAHRSIRLVSQRRPWPDVTLALAAAGPSSTVAPRRPLSRTRRCIPSPPRP